MPSGAYNSAAGLVQNASRSAALGNRTQALRELAYAQTLLPRMTPAEGGEMAGRIAQAQAGASQARTPQEVAAAKQELARQQALQDKVVAKENKILGGKDPGGQWWNPASWAYDDATIQNQTYTYGGTGSGGAQAPVGGTPGFFDTLARKTASALPESWTGVRNPDPNSFGNQFRDIANKAILVVAVVGGGYVLVTLLGYMTAAKRVQMSSNPRRRRRR